MSHTIFRHKISVAVNESKSCSAFTVVINCGPPDISVGKSLVKGASENFLYVASSTVYLCHDRLTFDIQAFERQEEACDGKTICHSRRGLFPQAK